MQRATLLKQVCSTSAGCSTLSHSSELSSSSSGVKEILSAFQPFLCAAAWSGRVSNLRRLRGALLTAPLCRSATSNTNEGGAASSDCRQRWFQRQLQARTLIPVDLIPLAQRVPVPQFASQRAAKSASGKGRADVEADAMTDAFLSCCTSPLCDPHLLRSVFAQLNAGQQMAVLSATFTRGLQAQLSCLEACVEEALASPGFAFAQWLRVLSCVWDADPAFPFPVVAIMKHILQAKAALSSVPADEVRQFVSVALHLLEAQRTASSVIVECLESCGLDYEACAYAASSTSTTFCPFCFSAMEWEMDGVGYGALLHSICALPRPPLQWFRTVRQTMPPVLQRHATLTLLHAAVRRCGGVTSDESETWRLFTADLMTPLEAASALHFLLREGSALTAGLLLQHSHTEQQLLTLMRYTHSAPHRLSFDALERLLLTRRDGRVVVHLRLESRGRRTSVALQCEAVLGGCPLTTAAATPEAAPGNAEEREFVAQTLSVGPLDRGYIHQYLRGALPRSVVACGERSLAQMLAAIPPGTVDHVAQSLPTMHSDALSWWVSLYLRGGNVEGAFAVLSVIAARGCLPHMAVLVELLEHTQDDTSSFVRGVAVVRRDFPTVAETVLRAFVERTATRMSSAAVTPQSMAQAVQTLKALAVMGLPRLSVRVLGDMAAHGAPDTIEAMLALAGQLCGARTAAAGVVALDVAAIRGLVAAGAALHYRVGLSVLSAAADGTLTGWWGSASRPRRTLTHLAYTTQDLSLWPWVKAEALSDDGCRLARKELHWAMRVVALGSRDAAVTVAFWNAVQERLRGGQAKQPQVHRGARRGAHDSEAYTLACVAAVCLARGQSQLAFHVLRTTCGYGELPPLLTALLGPHEAPVKKEEHQEKRVENVAPCKTSKNLPRQLWRLVRASGPEVLAVFQRSPRRATATATKGARHKRGEKQQRPRVGTN